MSDSLSDSGHRLEGVPDSRLIRLRYRNIQVLANETVSPASLGVFGLRHRSSAVYLKAK